MLRHILFTMVLSSTCAHAAEPYQVEEVKYTGGPYKNESFEYTVMKPDSVVSGQKYPLVLFLHGAGERGQDTKLLQMHLPKLMATEKYRKRFPCFFVAPQCRKGKLWANHHWSDKTSKPMKAEPSHQLRVTISALKATIEKYPIDTTRIYLTGLSMGGFGSWELAIRHPDWFAAVAPICGGGDETKAHVLNDVPVWAAHGDKDGVVIIDRSRGMIEAIKKAGGKPTFVEYAGVGHNSWTPAYTDEKGLLPWMFQQKRKTPAKFR